MKHKLFYFLLLTALLLSARAALLPPATPVAAYDERGTEFWLAFPLNHTGADALELYITSDVNASGMVTIGLPASPSWSMGFSVTANNITTVVIPVVHAEVLELEEEVNRGIHVTADEQVVVYGLSYKTAGVGSSADAYLGLPVDALGTDYIVLAYPTDNVVDAPGSMFTVVATEDNTTVDIIPTADTWNYLAGFPYQITLNAGQTFMSYVDFVYDGDDLTGTEISADKPIAVFGGNRAANVPVDYESADFLIEQLPPVSAWGMEFVSMPLATYTNYPGTYRFLASEDDTQITINGTPLALTLNRGAVYEDNTLTAPLHITSDKPILAAQYANSQAYENPDCLADPGTCNWDPFMMLLPPAPQWRDAYVINAPSSRFEADYLNIVAPTGATITLDGTPLSDFTPIGTGYMGKQVSVSDGAHVLSGDAPFGVYVYGFTSEGSYGYPGGSGKDPAPAGTGVIGNSVWLDEDGDGVQDAGESGIPNVTVELYDDTNTLIASTITDANGGYSFKDVPLGSYTIKVNTGSLPAGLAAHPTYDEDGGYDSQSAVTLTTAGQEHLTANFGYNWVPPTHSANPPLGATGAIGNRIWNDADGNGRQDPGEAGLAGVTVSLLTDDNGDGVYGGPGDNPPTTTTTDAAGYFIFDDIAPGSYVISVTEPSGWTPTGDPDEVGACVVCDSRTAPIELAPGDVYLNADFGYQLDTGGSAIGGTVFVDPNGDGVVDAGEPGLPGVTVALLDDSGEVIATTITDANGEYLFPGLPAGDYTVWVTDTDNVLGDLDPISDADGIGTPHRSEVTVDGIVDDLTQNFGYAPPGHANGDGLIGQFIYHDANGNGSYDPGESGLEGVKVTLTTPGGDIVTYTDENGFYFFGALPAGDYTITVELPTGMAYSDDPDATVDGSATVTLTDGEVNLNQTFGLEADTASPNTISGTIWNDTDGQGDKNESGRIAGVTVVLRDSDGNIVGKTVTDGDGNYSFPGLPDGAYTVDVTDDDNILDGYWHSDGVDSQPDPYTLTVSGGADETVDFGYYRELAVLSGYIWEDFDPDGLQGGGEVGIPNVLVQLVITYPNGDIITVTTKTDSNGEYSFGNLLADEDYLRGGDTGQPTYHISVPLHQIALAGYGPTIVGAGGGTNDSDDHDGVDAFPEQGATDDTFDFGYVRASSTGGTLWHDVNPDGVLGSGDELLAGVTVQLYTADGLTLLATTITDSNGDYIFNGLAPVSYVIAVPAPGFGYSLDGAPNPNNDVKGDDNGGFYAGGGVRSLPVILEPLDVNQNGFEPDTPVDGDNNRSNRTVDFGFTNSPTAVTITAFSVQSAGGGLPYVALATMLALAMMGWLGVWKKRQRMLR